MTFLCPLAGHSHGAACCHTCKVVLSSLSLNSLFSSDSMSHLEMSTEETSVPLALSSDRFAVGIPVWLALVNVPNGCVRKMYLAPNVPSGCVH